MMESKNPTRTVKILLVEANRADAGLMEYFLAQSRFSVQLRLARDGEEALSVLRQSTSFGGKEDPDLILLDLNLPKVDGREVLKKIKTDPGLKKIPVIVLTGSDAEEDAASTRLYHADSFIVKPAAIKNFNDVLREIETFMDKVGRETI